MPSSGLGAKIGLLIAPGPSTISRSTRSGLSIASLSATCPPIELPMKCARSIPVSAMKALMTRELKARRSSSIGTFSLLPNWGMSTSTARKRSASAPTFRRKLLSLFAPGPAPWRQITGSPSPTSL